MSDIRNEQCALETANPSEFFNAWEKETKTLALVIQKLVVA